MDRYYVVHINDKGQPVAVDRFDTFEDAKECCAKCAEENGIDDDQITMEILHDDCPGVFFSEDRTDASGVWVVSDIS